MIISLLIGLMTGFLMCIPIGPINVWVVNTLIKHDFKSAFSIAVGGAVMDFVYFMVILTGLSIFQFSIKTILILKISGVILLMIFGLKELFSKKIDFQSQPELGKKKPTIFGCFLLGVAIYTSNPTLLATMSALAAIIKSWNLILNNMFSYFFLSLGLGIGSASWFYFLLKLVNRYHKKLPEKFFININRISGMIIVLLSLYMAFNVYKENVV